MADITTTLGLDDRQFLNSIKNAEQSVTNFGNKFNAEIGKLNNSLGTLKEMLGIAVVAKFVSEIAKSAVEIRRLSEATGMTISSITNFKKELASVGATGEQATSAIADFSKNVGEAANNGGDVLKAFNQLGISLSDIASLDEQDLMAKTVEGLKKIGPGAEQAALQAKIFGDSLKGVPLGQISSGFTQYTAKSLESADAIRKAAEATVALNKVFSAITNQVLILLKPFAEFTSKLLEMQGVGSAISSTLVGIAAALTALFVVEKLVKVFQWASAALLMFGTAASRLVPWVGAAVIAFEILNGVLKGLTDNSIFEWIEQLAVKMGIISKTSKESAEAMAEEKNESAKLRDEKVRKLEVLEKEKKAMDQVLMAYQRSNAEQVNKMQLDTAMIGKGEELKNSETALAEMRKRNADQVAELNKKISETTDPTLQAQYAKSIEDVNEVYKIQSATLEDAIERQKLKNREDRQSIFNNQEIEALQKRVTNLQLESATMALPALVQEYKKVEKAAREAVDAELLAEAKKRGGTNAKIDDLPTAYVEGERAKAAARAETEKAEMAANARAKAAEAERQYGIKERIQSENDLRGVQDEINKLTLTEMEKKNYDIAAAAKARAKAEIEAQEALLNRRLDPAEAEAYYKAAAAGVEDLKNKTRELDDASRTWNTGWTQAMNDYVRTASDGAANAKAVFSTVFKGMEDLIINFAKTGKLEWKGLVNSIIEQLLRQELQANFARLFGGGSGAGSGGGGLFGAIGSGISKFAGMFAQGGNIPAGQFGIAGEAGAEIITGPATVTPMANLSGGGATNITYNISAVDARSFQQLVAADPSFMYAVTLKGQRMMPGGR